MGRREGVIGSVVIGIVGAVIGSFLARLLSSNTQSYFDLSWPGVIWAFIGAVIFVAILNAIQKGSRSKQL